MLLNRSNRAGTAVGIALLCCSATLIGAEPPALNPFAPRSQVREDAILGYAELSDGTQLAGRLYLTRDTRLKIYDAQAERQREIPLRVVQRIDCSVAREWLEREWRFRENANDEKVYTGRTYPARLYEHRITLHDGRSISGPLSAVIYVQPATGGQPQKLILHKRDKGPIGTDLKTMTYVRTVRLGDQAYDDATGRTNGEQAPAPNR